MVCKYKSFIAKAGLIVNVAILWDIAPFSPYVSDVSEERITSIFRVENQQSKKPVCSRWLGDCLG
jgi:hypothetical protein